MYYTTGNSTALAPTTYNALFNYRYEVFVERLGWELDTPRNWEQDEFDQPETVYVIAHNDLQEITGCSRLLPTTSDYLLEVVFPELMNGQEIPKQQDVWELSRFTSMDPSQSAESAHQFSAESSIELMKASIDCARSRGAKKLITVSPIGVERLLKRAGFKIHRAGAPKKLMNYSLVALWVEVD